MTTTLALNVDQRLTLANYLAYRDSTDTLYELVQGELFSMPLGTGLHGDISDFLNMQFQTEIARLNHPWVSRQMAIGLQSPRGYRWDTCRIPDVMVLPREQWQALRQKEAVITAGQNPPLLVVEVVSASTKTTDYRHKRAEYNVLEIPEYWIVDPLEGQITILSLVEGLYDAQEFRGDQVLQSPTFPELPLTSNEILDPVSEA